MCSHSLQGIELFLYLQFLEHQKYRHNVTVVQSVFSLTAWLFTLLQISKSRTKKPAQPVSPFYRLQRPVGIT